MQLLKENKKYIKNENGLINEEKPIIANKKN